MASDRTRELASLISMKFAPAGADKLLEITTLLDAFERETRLDEQQNHNVITAAAWRDRIAFLAAQPTPEVKK